jgi:DNA-binding transcriptional LysR family regulator
VDLDLRKLRYFVALADHLNYGRAAESLHIAQPVLSRQIRAFEDELRVQLFVRDKRRVELTPAGDQLLIDAGPLLAGADALQRRVNVAARGRDVFTVGFMPGLIVTAPARALEAAHPGLRVEVLRTTWDDQTAAIRDGRVDVSYVRLPIDQRGLRLLALFSEPRVVMLPATHPLAGRPSVSITELADEHLLQNPAAVPEWRDIAVELRSGSSAPEPELAYSVEEKLEHVASGRGIAVLPESVATFYRRPDLMHALIHDIGPNQISLAWDGRRRSKLIQDFAAIASDHPVTG